MIQPPAVVVDASVAVKWVLTEPGDQPALALLASYAARQVDLIAPRVLFAEVASALAKRHRRKHLTARQAEDAYRWFEERSPRIVDASMGSALALSLKHHLSLWDSIYLSLAIKHGAELVTADERLARSIRRHYAATKLIG